jgi:hypothetical protein
MRPFERVMRFWQQHCPGWPIVTADSDTDIFSLSQARNNAVRQAKTDVVMVADADTVPPIDSVLAAVADPVGITWPHDRWVLIPAEWAQRPVEDFPDAPIITQYPDGLGSCLVATRDEWWRLGGQDDRFIGWGYEDSAFYFVASTLSTLRKLPGTTYSIDHNDEDGRADSPGWDRREYDTPNATLIREYQIAAGRPWMMREVLKHRYTPVADTTSKALAGRYRG